MSETGMERFLRALFIRETSGRTKIVNEFGYAGKYQFGEAALEDLGYFKGDGKPNSRDGKFLYDWGGVWTGKNGATSLAAFLDSEALQDKAAEEWVLLLCRNGKHYGADKFYGQTIAGIQVTESGVIAAAHLKGYGSGKPDGGRWRAPGVLAFLRTGGRVDAADAKGTLVSSYMSKFGGYQLGCCSPQETPMRWAYPFDVQSNPDAKTKGAAVDSGAYLGVAPNEVGALSRVDDGFYPLGANGLWHGGIHFDAGSGTLMAQAGGVRCIKDGEVIAYRIDREYPAIEFPQVRRKALYASGFALVRHTLDLPADALTTFDAEAEKSRAKTETAPSTKAGPQSAQPAPSAATAPAPVQPKPADQQAPKQSAITKLTFYSLYMHLADFKSYESISTRQRPDFWSQSSEFVVGTKAKDQQEVPPPPLDLKPVAEDIELVSCGCGGELVSPLEEALSKKYRLGQEWDNVSMEMHPDE